MAKAIQVQNLSKQYRLGQIGTGSLTHDINRWWHTVRGKEDPYLKIGEANDRTTKGNSNYVWSLRDIDFEIEQGDSVGIIGRNGAGKSTLLKILSRVTAPTTGNLKVKGRIASLLEVGTGFHPELSGRDNIYLNGAILGMRKQEIKRKFDEIVDFAGVERYIDTPVKRYSSGMYVRLAFAVAAYLESEILIVDEVLAVGDAEFQKKCLGKMNDVSKSEGRTILFVSHNMAAVKNLCLKAVVLENGRTKFSGSATEGIQQYLINNNSEVVATNLENLKERSGTGRALFSSLQIENDSGEILQTVLTGENITLVFKIRICDETVQKIDIGFSLHDALDELQSYLYSSYQDKYFDLSKIQDGYITVKCIIKNFPFSNGKLNLRGRLLVDGIEADWPHGNLGIINIQSGDFFETGKTTDMNSPFLIKGQWE